MMTKTLFILSGKDAKTVQEFFADENHGEMYWRSKEDGTLEVCVD